MGVSCIYLPNNLIFCFAGTISSPQRGTQCASLKENINRKESRGAFKVSNPTVVGVTKREGD